MTTKYSIAYRSDADLQFADKTEDTAFRFVMIFALIQAAVLLISNWSHTSVPLVGQLNSVGGHALITGVLIALIVSPMAYIRGIRFRGAQRSAAVQQKRAWGVIPLTIGVVLLTGLMIIMGFSVVSESFTDLTLDLMSTMTILMILAGGLAYIITRSLMLARASMLFINLAVFYLFATLFFATYFQDNPYWWQKSFSYLGMTDSNSRFIFDLGLIFTGILVVVWQFYFMEKFNVLQHDKVITSRTYQIIRWTLILIGVLIACVGIFRYGIGPFFNVVHDTSATGMGVLTGLLMLLLYWLVPGYRRTFYAISMIMAVMIASAALFKAAGIFSLVGLELAGFVIAGLWLLLFERNTNLLAARTIIDLKQEKTQKSTV